MHCTIVACFKNEAPFLREWIEFHRLAGFDSFVLYNNNSSDGYLAVLQQYIERGIVHLQDCPLTWCQLPVYYHALHTNVTQAQWLAFIDIDEFMFCPDGKSIKTLLADFGDAAALVAPWRIYGSSGHIKRPDGLVIENYTHRAELDFPPNRHVKSIVQAGFGFVPLDAHRFFYRQGLPQDELHRHSPEPFVVDDKTGVKIRVNHYFCKSREDWNIKRGRGVADRINGAEAIRPDSDFDYHDRNEVADNAATIYLPELKRILSNS